MSNLVVRYRTKAEHADENQELVEAVFASCPSVARLGCAT